MRTSSFVALVSCALCLACGTNPDPNTAPDAGSDTQPDAGTDNQPDAGEEPDRLQEGDDCYDNLQAVREGKATPSCDVGLYCHREACPGTCTPTPAIGEACNGSPNGPIVLCNQEEARCEQMGPQGTCVALNEVASGGECSPGDKCPEGEACIDHDANFMTNNTCATPRTQGESCSSEADCEEGLACDGDGKCGPLPKLGEECHGACEGGAYCDYSSFPGTCTAPKAEGETCQLPGDCESGACTDGKCEAVCAAP